MANTEQDFFQILGNFSDNILKYCAFLLDITIQIALDYDLPVLVDSAGQIYPLVLF